jgi:triosephosphate isomerase
MEALLFYIGLAVIVLFATINIVLTLMGHSTRRRYLKRMDEL